MEIVGFLTYLHPSKRFDPILNNTDTQYMIRGIAVNTEPNDVLFPQRKITFIDIFVKYMIKKSEISLWVCSSISTLLICTVSKSLACTNVSKKAHNFHVTNYNEMCLGSFVSRLKGQTIFDINPLKSAPRKK